MFIQIYINGAMRLLLYENLEYIFDRIYTKDGYGWMNDHDESILYDHISSIYFHTSLNSRPT